MTTTTTTTAAVVTVDAVINQDHELDVVVPREETVVDVTADAGEPVVDALLDRALNAAPLTDQVRAATKP